MAMSMAGSGVAGSRLGRLLVVGVSVCCGVVTGEEADLDRSSLTSDSESPNSYFRRPLIVVGRTGRPGSLGHQGSDGGASSHCWPRSVRLMSRLAVLWRAVVWFLWLAVVVVRLSWLAFPSYRRRIYDQRFPSPRVPAVAVSVPGLASRCDSRALQTRDLLRCRVSAWPRENSLSIFRFRITFLLGQS